MVRHPEVAGPRRGTRRSPGSVSPASSRRAALNSRTVSSIRKRVPGGRVRHLEQRLVDQVLQQVGRRRRRAAAARASAVNPPGKTDSARIAAWPAGSSRFQLQSTTACSVRCRSGASRAPPRSSANRSSSRRAISATDITRTRAAASSTASGSPSRCRHSSATTSGGSSTPGRAARARWPNSSTDVGRSSSGSRYTDSEDRPSGARLVVSTRRSLVIDTRARTSSAAPRTTCSQLSSTSSDGPGPRAAAMPATTSGPRADGTDRQPPGSPDAEGGRDLAGHVVVGA